MISLAIADGQICTSAQTYRDEFLEPFHTAIRCYLTVVCNVLRGSTSFRRDGLLIIIKGLARPFAILHVGLKCSSHLFPERRLYR